MDLPIRFGGTNASPYFNVFFLFSLFLEIFLPIISNVAPVKRTRSLTPK